VVGLQEKKGGREEWAGSRGLGMNQQISGKKIPERGGKGKDA
jgi:hypothetical protein